MPNLSEILNDPNYLNANEETKAAIFTKYAPLDENYTQANAATQGAIRNKFGVEGQEGMGPRGGLDAGIYSGYQQAKSAFSGLGGRTGLMSLESAKAIQEEAEDKRRKAFKPSEKSLAEDPLNKFGELLGQSLPFMVAPIVAGGVATLAGASGLAAAGISGLASAVQFTATNLARQQDTGVALEDTKLGNAVLASVPQAALETLSFRMYPIVQKIFGAAGKPLTAAEATAITRQGLFKTAGEMTKTGVKVGATEGLTEVGQQFFERLQAGLNIADKDARNEYLESFVSGAILGSALSLPGAGVRRAKAEQVVEANKPQTFVEPNTGVTMTASPVELTDSNLELAGTQDVNGRTIYIYAPKPETISSETGEQTTSEVAPPPPQDDTLSQEGVPSDQALDQAAMEEEWRRSQGELPIAPPAAPPAPIEAAPTTPPAAPEAEIVPLDDTAISELPLDAAPDAANQSVLPPPAAPEVIDPNIEAQLAAEPFDSDSIILPPKEEPIPAAPKAVKEKASERILSAHEFIASLGGLNKKEASEINPDDAKPNVRIGNKWLYASKGGLSAGQAAQKLAEAGYINTEYNNDVYRVISESLANPVYSIYDADAVAERKFNEQALDEAERFEERQARAGQEARDINADVAEGQNIAAADLKDFRQQMLDAGYTEQDLNVIRFTKASPELQAEVIALHELAINEGLYPIEILERLDIASADRRITKQEYYAKAKTELGQAIAEKAQQRSDRDAGEAAVQESAEREEVLTAPTAEELKAEQDATDKVAADKAKADREADATAKADAERKEIAARSEKAAGEFVLGKTAEEDLSGQKDVFSTPVYAERNEFLYNVSKNKKQKEFKTLDGFTFYLTEDGKVVDNLDPEKVDMSWDTFDDFMEATSNLRTIFPDQEIASSNSAEQIRKDNIAKYASLKQKLAAIQRRFVESKTKDFDKESYKYLYRQANDLKDAIESTKEPRTSPADFLARAAKELADGNISQEVYDVVDAMYKKNPSLLDGLRLSVKATDLDVAGQFFGLTKIVRLFKETEGVTNPSTLRHEVVHSLEQVMNQDAQADLVDAWGKALLKASRNAKTAQEKEFFVQVGKFLENPTKDTLLSAADAMPDYSYYQYINPSEFWAVNAESLMTSYLGGGWQRFKSSVKGLLEALKSVLGFDNKSVVYKTFNSVINGDKNRTSPMLVDYVSMVSKMLPTYNVTKPAAKPSPATLPGISPAPKSLPLKPRPTATWQSLDPMTWQDTASIALFDKHRNLDLVQKEIQKMVGEITGDLNAYRAETLAHGRAESSWKDFLKFELSPVITEMNNNKITDDALTEYLVMRHAKEANDLIAARNPNDPSRQDEGSGVSYKERDDYFKALDPAKKKVFESIAKKVDAALKKTRDLLEEGGVITKENREAWESMFEFYVPLRREESDYSLPSSSYRRVGNFAKSRTGSKKDVIDVLSNIAANREIAISRIEKEKVNRAVYGLTVMNPNPEYWMAISPDAIKNKDLLIEELEKNFDLTRKDAEDFVKNIMTEPTKERFNKDTNVVDRFIDTNAKYADYVLPVKIEGKDRFVFFNPKNDRAMQMVQSLRGLDVPKLGAVMQMIAPITRFFSAINTQYNLVFGAWNFARDVQGARLNLSTTPIADEKNAVLTGTFSAIPDIYTAVREDNAGVPFSDTSDGSWADFTRHGGKVGYKDQFSRLTQSTNIVNRELGKLNRGITMKGAYAILNWVSNANDVLENSTRLSAYRVALNKFKNEAEAKNPGGKISEKQLEDMKARAADIAKNITVNFNRKGTFGVTAGSLYAFFNASAQGTKRLYETLTGPKGKTIMAAGIGIGIAQAIALAFFGFDEDEPTEFMKQKNLIIPTGDGKYVMWPMPFGFNVFPNLGRIFFETASKASKGQDVTPQLINTVTMLANAFNPLGGGGLLQMITPTIGDPIVALIENKDAFGRPISRESRVTSPVPGYKLSRDPSPSISQFLAEFINTITFGDKDKKGLLSPTADQIDYLAKQVGGGVYREASGILTYVSNEIEGKETPDYKIPIAGKIVGDLNSPPAISQRFYSNVIKMAEHEASIKGRAERRENVSEYLRKNPEASMWRRANTLENEISKLNRRRRELVGQEAPVARIKQLDEQKTRMMKQFNDQVRKYQK